MKLDRRLVAIYPDDPIIQAWRGAFPDLFTPLSEMPTELLDNLRYHEDLFRIQTDVYSKYRIDPALFCQRDGNAWSVAQAPGTEPSQSSVATPRSRVSERVRAVIR